MSKIFITGIAGFLGSHLADAMLKEGHEVFGIDNLLGGYVDNVPIAAQWLDADCNDLERLRACLPPECDVVYHCAATAYEGLSVFSPHIVTQNIVGASAAVFSAAIAMKAKRIVFCSSMARYGSRQTPFHEGMVPAPQDPYGIGKVAAEQLLANLCQTHGVEYVVAVPHNIIGPRQKYDDPYRNVASIMMNLMLQGRRPTIYGDGMQRRCFSYIDDCLECLKAMAFYEVQGETINIGPDEQPITINGLYAQIAAITGFNEKPIYRSGRPNEVKVAICSSDKARELLGYRTQTPLFEGLVAMHDWMKARGTRPFDYHLPIEIVTPRTPRTWTEKLF